VPAPIPMSLRRIVSALLAAGLFVVACTSDDVANHVLNVRPVIRQSGHDGLREIGLRHLDGLLVARSIRAAAGSRVPGRMPVGDAHHLSAPLDLRLRTKHGSQVNIAFPRSLLRRICRAPDPDPLLS